MLDNLNSNFESSKAQRPDANDDEVEIDLLEIFYALKKKILLVLIYSGEEPERIWLYRRTVIRWKAKSLQRDSADDHCRSEERNKENYCTGG